MGGLEGRDGLWGRGEGTEENEGGETERDELKGGKGMCRRRKEEGEEGEGTLTGTLCFVWEREEHIPIVRQRQKKKGG